MAYTGVVVHAICCVAALLITLGGRVGAMECFSCNNVIGNVSNCLSTEYCQPDEMCSMSSTHNGKDIAYHLGCHPITNCTMTSTKMVGRRASASGLCHECCSSSYCNKKLCIFNTGGPQTVCHDDPQYNCALVASSFDICSDINHAKLVCRKHCGLCDLVDGAWSPWSGWSNCDQTCGIAGMQLRMRSCTNPAPAHGGSDCPGQMMQTTNCSLGPCPVDGGWGTWAEWSACDSTCDQGHRIRVRFCNNPTPIHGGVACNGMTSDQGNCTIKPCPVDGHWSTWAPWTACDVTCGHSQRLRIRTCTNPPPAHGGHDCAGSQMDEESCRDVPLHCPIDGSWAVWNAWTPCSKSCGAGLHSRVRNCSQPVPMYNGSPCYGMSEEYKVCVLQGCTDGVWSDWASWTTCSVTCDGGLMSRHRKCDNPANTVYGNPCVGTDVEYITCNRQNCPVESVFWTVDKPINSNNHATQLNFTEVITNEGHGYNASSGEFYAPTAGMYHVALTADGNSAAVANPQCSMQHNGHDVVTIHTHAGSTSSSSAYVQMAAGDQLQVFCDGGISFIDTGGSTTFSGALVMKT